MAAPGGTNRSGPFSLQRGAERPCFCATLRRRITHIERGPARFRSYFCAPQARGTSCRPPSKRTTLPAFGAIRRITGRENISAHLRRAGKARKRENCPDQEKIRGNFAFCAGRRWQSAVACVCARFPVLQTFPSQIACWLRQHTGAYVLLKRRARLSRAWPYKPNWRSVPEEETPPGWRQHCRGAKPANACK